MKITKKDFYIISLLRENSRISLTNMSRKTGIPVSTLFDKLKHFDFIKKYTVLLKYNLIGLNSRAYVAISIDKKQKQEFLNYLVNNPNVNNIIRINNGYDFMIDVIFKSLKQTEDFVEKLEFRWNILKKNVFYVIDEIQNEDFLSDFNVIDFMISNNENQILTNFNKKLIKK